MAAVSISRALDPIMAPVCILSCLFPAPVAAPEPYALGITPFSPPSHWAQRVPHYGGQKQISYRSLERTPIWKDWDEARSLTVNRVLKYDQL